MTLTDIRRFEKEKSELIRRIEELEDQNNILKSQVEEFHAHRVALAQDEKDQTDQYASLTEKYDMMKEIAGQCPLMCLPLQSMLYRYVGCFR